MSESSEFHISKALEQFRVYGNHFFPCVFSCLPFACSLLCLTFHSVAWGLSFFVDKCALFLV